MLTRSAVQRLLRPSQTRACSSVKQADAYCLELVKTHDYESFVSGLLVPKQHRGIYYALRAFNVEMATIKDQIPRNNVNAGRIRFQFWRDSLHQLYEGRGLSPSNNQPVAKALQHHMAHRDLKLRWFERMIESRFSDTMSPGSFESMGDLETYAEASHSSMLYLTLEAMGVRDENAEFMASHLGVCRGILTLLRGHAFHSSQGTCYFPRAVMEKHGLTLSEAMGVPKGELAADSPASQRFRDVVNDLASQAHAHLSRASELGKQGLPAGAIYALLPAVGARMHLDALEQQDFLLVGGQEDASHFFNLKLQLRLLMFLVQKEV